VPLAGAGLMTWFLRTGDRGGYVSAAAATAVAFVGLVAAFPPLEVDRYKSPRELVRAAGLADPGRDLRVGSIDWFQPSVVFYARREVHKLETAAEVEAFLGNPTPGYLFVPEPTWDAWFAGRLPVACRVAARHFDFYKNCDVLVITNQAGPREE
jgi:hypothetical protein